MKNDAAHHEENLASLSRIEGQVRAVRRMIEEHAYCVDILTQIQAAVGALRTVKRSILLKHMEHCLGAAFRSGKPDVIAARMGEIETVLKREEK